MFALSAMSTLHVAIGAKSSSFFIHDGMVYATRQYGSPSSDRILLVLEPILHLSVLDL